MRFSKLDELLQKSNRFSVSMETLTRVDVNHKLLLGTHKATEIDNFESTIARYSFVAGGVLHASYELNKRHLYGVNVYDKLDDISTEPFNMYGFSYDPDFEEFSFSVSHTNEKNGETMPVKFPDISSQDKRTIGSLCLAKAFVDLKSHNGLLVIQ